MEAGTLVPTQFQPCLGLTLSCLPPLRLGSADLQNLGCGQSVANPFLQQVLVQKSPYCAPGSAGGKPRPGDGGGCERPPTHPKRASDAALTGPAVRGLQPRPSLRAAGEVSVPCHGVGTHRTMCCIPPHPQLSVSKPLD